jgi:hypothetical protein
VLQKHGAVAISPLPRTKPESQETPGGVIEALLIVRRYDSE